MNEQKCVRDMSSTAAAAALSSGTGLLPSSASAAASGAVSASASASTAAMATTLGLSKVFILDKYFSELQKFWETEKRLQGKSTRWPECLFNADLDEQVLWLRRTKSQAPTYSNG